MVYYISFAFTEKREHKSARVLSATSEGLQSQNNSTIRQVIDTSNQKESRTDAEVAKEEDRKERASNGVSDTAAQNAVHYQSLQFSSHLISLSVWFGCSKSR